jgi:rubrerythrin
MENFQRIEELGLEWFLLEAEKAWTCPGCGALLSVHRPECLQCKAPNIHFKGNLK